jgi:hypothetical protein
LQNPAVNIKVCLSFKKFSRFFSNFRSDERFNEVLIDANVVVEELDVETNFPMPQTVRPSKKTKFFAYKHNDEPITDPKTSFTITVFFNILDQISSLKDRFENLQNFNDTFGSIYNMFTLTEDELLKSCKDLHVKLQDNAREESDIDGNGHVQ